METLSRVYFGNTLGTWIAAVAMAVVGVLVLLVLRRLVRRVLDRMSARTTNRVDDRVAAVVGATRGWFVWLLPILLGLGLLDLGPVANDVVRHLRTAVVVIQIGVWVSAALKRWTADVALRRATSDKAGVTSITVLRVALVVVLWVLVTLILLDNLGVDVVTLIAGLGVGGVAIALAVQGLLADLVASVVIVLDKPFVIGDFIIVGDLMGTVENIGLKTTRIRALSGEELVFSHSDLLGSRIRNYRTLAERRVSFEVRLDYETPPADLAAVPGLVRAVVESASPPPLAAGVVAPAGAPPRLRFDRSHIASFGEHAVVVETVYFVLDPDYNRYMDVHQRVLVGIHAALAERGVHVAVPARFTERVALPGEAEGGGDAPPVP